MSLKLGGLVGWRWREERMFRLDDIKISLRALQTLYIMEGHKPSLACLLA
jgi:hypothetical protein